MKNHAYWELPEDYRLYRNVRLADDRKTLIGLVVGQMVIVIAMLVWAGFLDYWAGLTYYEPWQFVMMILLTVIGTVVYVIGHEWVHGVFIRLFSGRPAYFGMKLKQGMFYAGSDAYYDKLAYIVIALAPLVVWGILLQLMIGECSVKYQLFLYMIQIINVSGAVGDLYVMGITLRAPKGTVIRDSGTDMTFYTPEESK